DSLRVRAAPGHSEAPAAGVLTSVGRDSSEFVRRGVPRRGIPRPMTLDPEICWRAWTPRDARFIGRFVMGVTSTRIYCRPGCPARLPARRHARFYVTPAAAEAAGFRACLRC